MQKIDKVILQNVQSHEETVLALSPAFNVVIGSTEGGKTAIMRGDRLLVDNKPLGTALVRKDKNDEPVGTLMVIHEYASGYKVARVRGKSINRYIITDPQGDAKTLEGFGNEVPEEVQEITGIRPAVFFDDGKGNKFAPVLNFAFQLEAPFMLSETPSLGAKVFGRLAGTELVDAALDDLNKDVFDANKRKRAADDEIAQKESALKQYEGLDLVRVQYNRAENMFNGVLTEVGRLTKLEALADALGLVDAEAIRVIGVLAALAGLQRAETTLAGVTVAWTAGQRLRGLLDDYTATWYDLTTANEILDRLTGLNALENALDGIKANQARAAGLEDLAEGYRKADEGLDECYRVMYLLDQVPEAEVYLRQLREKVTRIDLLTGLSTQSTTNEAMLAQVNERLRAVAQVDQAGDLLTGVQEAHIRVAGLMQHDARHNLFSNQLTAVRDRLAALGDPERAGDILQQVAVDRDRLTRLEDLKMLYVTAAQFIDNTAKEINSQAKEVQEAEAEYRQILQEAGVCPTCGQKIEGGFTVHGH